MLFLNPLWLFAIAAVSIPVIIHLWNIKSGKTLKVGSIALISAAAKKSSRSLVINNKLLLAIRCLLLIILALLLSMPVWRSRFDNSKTKGWLLMPQENLSESYRKFKPLVDSLTRSGYQFHYFNEGFSQAEITKALADTTKKQETNADYWVLIRQLNRQTSFNLPMYLITPNSVSHFKGDRPSVALSLKWKTYTPDDSISTWIADACFGENNDVQVLQAISKPTGTYFTKHTINSGSDNANFQVSINNGKAIIKQKKGDTTTVSIDNATLKLAIYTDKHAVDAGYLKAVLQAVVSFSGRKVVVKQYNNAGQIPKGQDWLFWLSDQKVPHQILKKSTNIFSYTSGTIMNTDSWIDNNGPFHIAGQADKIALHQLINNNKTTDEALWTDGFGRPVLSRENSTGIYHFYTRFNPAWTDLVWNDNFPQWMFRLIFDGQMQKTVGPYERRVMNPKESLPDIVQKKDSLTNKQSESVTDLSHYFWLLLAALFLLERFMAHHQSKPQSNHG